MLLFQDDRPAGRAAQTAPDSDVLRVRGPRKVTAIPSATFVAQRADKRVGGCDVD